MRDLLILGGSQGAKSLNCELPKLITQPLKVMHICGPERKDECSKAWGESSFEGEVDILESHPNIPQLLSESKWTISRAGATSICEMVGAKVGCICTLPIRKKTIIKERMRATLLQKGELIF